MDEFEYLAALVSVVAGLSLTRALSGFAKIVDSQSDVRLSGVHIAWTLSVILWLVGYWWFTFMLSSVEDWSVSLLLFVLAYGALIYLLIALLFPERSDTDADYLEIFISRRRPFFVTFVLLGFLDVADTIIKVKVYEMGHPPLLAYCLLMVSWISLGTVAALTENRWFHRVFAYSWLGISATWSLTTLVTL